MCVSDSALCLLLFVDSTYMVSKDDYNLFSISQQSAVISN